MPTQLFASWTTPEPTNGDITSYTVFCRENGAVDGKFMAREVVLGMETMVQLTDLLPFTAYECFVIANTSVGAGNASNLDVERTNEDSEYIHMHACTSNSLTFCCFHKVTVIFRYISLQS